MTYTNKFVKSSSYKSSMAKNDIDAYLLVAQPIPEFSMLQKAEQIIRLTDSTSVNVFKFGSDYVSVSDTWKVYSFNRTNLNTIKSIIPEISGIAASLPPKYYMSTGHPLPMSGTDRWLTYGLAPGFRSAVIDVLLIKSANERQLITRIPVDENYYMHSFGATENYVVFFAHPFHYDIATILEKMEILDAFRWNPEAPTYIYVVNLKTAEVRKFTTESRFITHHINGFEIGDLSGKNGNPSLVMDFVTYDDPAIVTTATMDLVRNPEARGNFSTIKAEIMRYTVHLSNETVTRQTFPIKPRMDITNKLDFPAINEKFRYRKYCNVYGVYSKGVERMNLVKKDLCNHMKDLIWSVPNHYASEPWFVANPDATTEDDGVLLDVVLDGNKGKSYLAVFDAKTMKLINRAYLPNFIPIGLHGRLFV